MAGMEIPPSVCLCLFGRARPVLRPHPDHLHDIEQIVQGVGAVPQLMLAPEAGGDRNKQELVDVRGFGGQVLRGAASEGEPLSPKKPSRVKSAASSVRRRQAAASCSSSGIDQKPSE